MGQVGRKKGEDRPYKLMVSLSASENDLVEALTKELNMTRRDMTMQAIRKFAEHLNDPNY
jgi:hypothetical protein